MNVSISHSVAKQAAHWLMLLHSGEATEQNIQACNHWRAQSSEHEQAWARAQKVQQQLGLIPTHLGMKTLDRDSRLDRRTLLKSLTLMIITAPVSYGIYQSAPVQALAHDYHTGKGQQQQITLADGTLVKLNTDTSLDVQYNADQRELILHHGEILIETTIDPLNRPLFVRTPQGRLQPIGTRFLVRQLNESSVRLSVFEGAVRIHPRDGYAQEGSAQITLEAGKTLRFSRTHIGTPEPLNQADAAWTRGLLSVQDIRLADFLLELNRYRSGVLRCNPAVADLRISGTFQLKHSEQILAALPNTLPVSISSITPYWITIGPR